MANIIITMKENHFDEVIENKNEAVKKALNEIGIQVQNYATAICPHDTGRLEGSITYKTATNQSSPRAPASSGDGVPGTPDDKTVIIGTAVEYAGYVEFGTSKYPHPRPFMKPAMEDHQTEYLQIIEENLQTLK